MSPIISHNAQLSVYELSRDLGHRLLSQSRCCAVAESCTGGGIAAAITDIPGSSQWFDRGFVTYTNASKHEMLDVPESLIIAHGAVSEAVVRAMADGALIHSHADMSVAVSGVAGPGGGSLEKPVGTIWFAWASHLQPTQTDCFTLSGDRLAIRQQAVHIALNGLLTRCC